MDVSDEASVKAGFAKIKEKFGRIDVSTHFQRTLGLPAIRDNPCACFGFLALTVRRLGHGAVARPWWG